MSNALTRIGAYKRGEVDRLKAEQSLQSLLEACKTAPPVRSLRKALSTITAQGENGLICEIKRKSPSAGDIAVNIDPCDIARQYESGGAGALSVLTDGPSFGGSISDLMAIRQAVDLPVLRKDFMIDPVQIAEARAYGADCILIILSLIDDVLASELLALTHELGMDALIETHNRAEIMRAKALNAQFIGINNRDLTRMVTDLSVTEALAPGLSDDIELVSESGIREPIDISRLRRTGARRFLIGESLMIRKDRSAHVKALRSAV